MSSGLTTAEPALDDLVPTRGPSLWESDNPAGPNPSGSRCIVFACDEAYAMPLATALASLTESRHGEPALPVFVLSASFSPAMRDKVLHSVPPGAIDLGWISIDLSAFQSFSTLPYTSRMTYARLLVPHLLPPSITTALYLDADLLVLGKVDTLLKVHLQGSAVGAVLDPLDRELKAQNPAFRHLPAVRNYFNAGVLLIDLERWKKEQISERAMSYLQDHPLAPFADQDALNAACDGLWIELDPRWNYQHCKTTDLARTPLSERPAIAHFVMSGKPWNAAIRNINANFYDSFRDRTHFGRTIPDRIWDLHKKLWCATKRWIKRRLPPPSRLDKSKEKGND